LIEEAK